MATPGNVEVVSRIIGAISRRDVDAMLADVGAECEFTPMVTAWPEAYRGHDGIRRWFTHTSENWETFEVEIDAMRELDDDTVLSAVSWRGRPRGSADELDGPAVAIWRLRDGKAIWARVFPDEHRALEELAAGADG